MTVVSESDVAAFLATTTTRLAINTAQSARMRRETYIGPWLPNRSTSADPALGAERGEALELAVLMLLEKLSPTERAAYVLRGAFDHSYREVAEVLELSEANARQRSGRSCSWSTRRSSHGSPACPVSAAEAPFPPAKGKI